MKMYIWVMHGHALSTTSSDACHSTLSISRAQPCLERIWAQLQAGKVTAIHPATRRDSAKHGNVAAGRDGPEREPMPEAQKAAPGRKTAKESVDVGRPITAFFNR